MDKSQALSSREVHDHTKKLMLVDTELFEELNEIVCKVGGLQTTDDCLKEYHIAAQMGNVDAGRAKLFLAVRNGLVRYICNH